MTATIFVSLEAWKLSQVLKDVDYYDRCTMSDDPAIDPTGKDGYYFKNANKINLAPLPEKAHVALKITPENMDRYFSIVSVPENLRGCIFSQAPHLPDRYQEIVSYWSGEPLNSNVGCAAYYQCPAQSYMVDLSILNENKDLFSQRQSVPEIDAILSEGVVVSLSGLGSMTAGMAADEFIEIAVVIDEELVDLDNGNFLTDKCYNLSGSDRVERFWLLVDQVRNSPCPDRIFIDLLRYEELDYGFYY